jgi:hypothetical protein
VVGTRYWAGHRRRRVFGGQLRRKNGFIVANGHSAASSVVESRQLRVFFVALDYNQRLLLLH